MAKKSKVVKNDKRRLMVASRAQLRRDLKRVISSPGTPAHERAAAVAKMAGLPRDSSPTTSPSKP